MTADARIAAPLGPTSAARGTGTSPAGGSQGRRPVRGRWLPRLVALGLWGGAAASAVFWVLKFGAGPQVPPSVPVASIAPAAGAAAPDVATLAQALGARPSSQAAPAAASAAAANALQGRLVLTGVVSGARPGAGNAPSQASAPQGTALQSPASQPTGRGVALIALDGKPPRPYAVGARIDDGLMLQSVGVRSAVIAADAKGPPLITLELPKPQR